MDKHSARITSRTILEWHVKTTPSLNGKEIAFLVVTNKNEVLYPPPLSFKGTINQICKQMPPLPPGSQTSWFYRGARIIGIDDGDHVSRIPSEIDTLIRCLDRKGAIAYLDREPTQHKEGRPKVLEGAQTVTVTLDRPSLEKLDSLGDNRSEAIRRLLRSQRP